MFTCSLTRFIINVRSIAKLICTLFVTKLQLVMYMFFMCHPLISIQIFWRRAFPHHCSLIFGQAWTFELFSTFKQRMVVIVLLFMFTLCMYVSLVYSAHYCLARFYTFSHLLYTYFSTNERCFHEKLFTITYICWKSLYLLITLAWNIYSCQNFYTC